MATDRDGSSDFTPPDGWMPLITAVRWSAFHFGLSRRFAHQFLWHAIIRGNLPAGRATESGMANAVPLCEVSRWHAQQYPGSVDTIGEHEAAAEQFHVQWADVSATLADYFLEPQSQPSWPARSCANDWCDIPEAPLRLASALSLPALDQPALQWLIMLAILLRLVPVGTHDGDDVRPVILALHEKLRMQQGSAEARYDLLWNWRCVARDPNCQPYGERPYGPTVSWLAIEAWHQAIHGPAPMLDQHAERAVIEPVVHVPTLKEAIHALSGDPERVRHAGVQLPVPPTGPQPVKVADTLTALRSEGRAGLFTRTGNLQPRASEPLLEAVKAGRVATWIAADTPGACTWRRMAGTMARVARRPTWREDFWTGPPTPAIRSRNQTARSHVVKIITEWGKGRQQVEA
jgi:hypothetical protein